MNFIRACFLFSFESDAGNDPQPFDPNEAC